ncbi:MRN complex-interacting protein-like [Saccostrea echinata]|uniref:MRN complex-interacting protein-like n=1 Tax=Saccostrea echinata TaxID=191078 RepID=UPI002A816A42|nr:MRN complex-interacting protein-like [Saccostrea echinata]
MPQEFHVLQCYSCATFQVQQVKKSSNKWNCKLCGEKQSIKKVFGRGSGADCRHHVQRLNTLRQQQDVSVAISSYQNFSEDNDSGSTQIEHEENLDVPCDNSGSKWSQYVEKAREESTSDNSDSKWSQYVEEACERSTSDDQQPGEDLYTTDGNQFYRSKKRKRDSGSSYSNNRKGQMSQGDDLDFSSKRTWKRQKENLQYGNDTYISAYNNTQPYHNFSQPKSYTSDPNNYVPHGTKSSLQSIANFNDESLFTISNRDYVAGFEEFETLKTIDQNRISANATDSEPKPKNTPKTKSYSLSSNRECKESKWDQFLAEGSDEDLEDTEKTSAENPLVVQPQSIEPARLQSKVPETRRVITSSKYEDYKCVTVTGSEIGMFSVGDLEDSDFDI